MGRYPQMRRRPLTAGAIAVRRMRWTRLVKLPSSRKLRARRASTRRRPRFIPRTSGSGYSNATAPYASTDAESGAPSAKRVRH